MKKIAGVFLLFFLTAATGAQTRKHRQAPVVSDGLWGGEHIRMVVADENATFELDCANGEIRGPLTLDKNGAFAFTGTLTRQGPGPIRIGREPRATPVRFTGKIKGNTMTIAVTSQDTKRPDGTYTLTRGREVRLHKCY